MKFKKLWKTTNRGVLLGIFLVLVLVLYIGIDTMTFNSEKHLVEEAYQNYMEDYIKELPMKEGFISSGATWTDGALQEKRDAMAKVLDTHWTNTYYKSAMGYGERSKSSVLGQLFMAYPKASSDSTTGYVKDASYKMTNSKVRKSGPGGALFSCTFKLDVDTIGNASYLDAIGQSNATDHHYYSDESNKLTADSAITTEYEYEMSVELLREDGEWKISKINTNGYSSSSYETAQTKEVE